MPRYTKVVAVLLLIFLFGLACGSARKKKDTLEVKFKKIDVFIAGLYEVGALEYEPRILPEGKILRYVFPVYFAGDKIREFQVNLYGIPEDFATFSQNKLSENDLQNMSLLWLLEERTKGKPYEVLKRYEITPTYQQIKQDVMEILSRRSER